MVFLLQDEMRKETNMNTIVGRATKFFHIAVAASLILAIFLVSESFTAQPALSKFGTDAS